MRGRSPRQIAAREAALDDIAAILAACPMSVREIREALADGEGRIPAPATVYARLAALKAEGVAAAEERAGKIAGKSGKHEMVWRIA